MNKPKVLNKYKCVPTENSVYIGRPSKWGNPFIIGKDGTREQVIAKFKELILSKPEFVKEIKRELKGKDLVCFCAPNICHGDVLLEIANDVKNNNPYRTIDDERDSLELETTDPNQ